VKNGKLLFFIAGLLLTASVVSAQDDDLPPPTSKPKSEQGKKPDEEFVGFKPKKKIDLSKFIIEPNFNFSIGQGRIDAGLAPYVGYKVFEPKNVKGNAGNVGLFVGGGVTYFYTGFTGIQVMQGSQVIGKMSANFHTYGGGVFLQYNIWKGLFARARFEVLHRTMDDVTKSPIPRNPNNYAEGFYFPKIEKTIPALLIGAGYNLLQSKNFFFPIVISYNILHPFTTPDQRAYSLYPRGLVVQLGFINIF
jgi:hypothetical protein